MGKPVLLTIKQLQVPKANLCLVTLPHYKYSCQAFFSVTQRNKAVINKANFGFKASKPFKHNYLTLPTYLFKGLIFDILKMFRLELIVWILIIEELIKSLHVYFAHTN